jgi:hypothetical protein
MIERGGSYVELMDYLNSPEYKTSPEYPLPSEYISYVREKDKLHRPVQATKTPPLYPFNTSDDYYGGGAY